MTDQLLPPDDLRAIEARAENWQDLNLDFLAFQDIPALLAHIRAQDAALERLRGELAAVKSIASEIRGALEDIHGLARKDMLVDHAHEGSVRDLARAAGKALLKLEYPETDDDEGE